MKTRFILLSVILFLYSVNAKCCSCFTKGRITVEDYNSYDHIFIGTLISEIPINEKYYGRIAKYKITKAYKEAFVGDTIQVYDAIDVGACGLGTLKIGKSYLIYALADKKKKFTTDCFRTTAVPDYTLPNDSAVINHLMRLKYFGRIFQKNSTNFYADTVFLNKHILRITNHKIQTFYDENGKIAANGKYLNGLPSGFWNYYKDGKPSSRGKYINGKKDSLWVEPFLEESVYIREYRNGEYTFRKQHFFDGKISSEQGPAKDGKKWIAYNYHSNGQPRTITYTAPPQRNADGELESPVSNGLSETYNSKGVLLESGITDYGYMTGHWKYYYEDGKLRMEGGYVKGEKNGLWKIYYPNKIIKATGTYQNGQKNNDWKYYDEKGHSIFADETFIKEDEDWFTYTGVKGQ